MSLHYLVKITIHILQMNVSWNRERKKAPYFYHLLQNEADSEFG